MNSEIPNDGKEHIVRAFSTHWVKYIQPISIFVIVMLSSVTVLSAAYFMKDNLWPFAIGFFLAGSVFITLAHHWFFHTLLSEAMEDVIITTKRIIWIKESLYQMDDIRQIPLENIHGVEAIKHGFSQTVLRYGNVWFDTGGTTTSDENAKLTRVPHPNQVARDINILLGITQ